MKKKFQESKTMILATLGVIGSIALWALGKLDAVTAGELVFGCLVAMGLRDAIPA